MDTYGFISTTWYILEKHIHNQQAIFNLNVQRFSFSRFHLF